MLLSDPCMVTLLYNKHLTDPWCVRRFRHSLLSDPCNCRSRDASSACHYSKVKYFVCFNFIFLNLSPISQITVDLLTYIV